MLLISYIYLKIVLRYVYKLKHDLKQENQGILLMITDGEKWHYIALKKLSTLLRGITSKHIEIFIV